MALKRKEVSCKLSECQRTFMQDHLPTGIQNKIPLSVLKWAFSGDRRNRSGNLLHRYQSISCDYLRRSLNLNCAPISVTINIAVHLCSFKSSSGIALLIQLMFIKSTHVLLAVIRNVVAEVYNLLSLHRQATATHFSIVIVGSVGVFVVVVWEFSCSWKLATNWRHKINCYLKMGRALKAGGGVSLQKHSSKTRPTGMWGVSCQRC